MRFEHAPFPVRGILDARPRGGDWAILTRNGPWDPEGLQGTLELHVSSDGRFAAVVERYGRFGRVFGADGRRTMNLDRGDYHPDTSVFPAAFVDHGGRPLLIHGTDWNRLDVSDPATGELLTARGPTSYREGEPRPAHYLDYFHGGLAVSPDGRWVAEDGWIWHPLGDLRLWSLTDWLAGNFWESEDGPSLRSLTQRVYLWDAPLCWIDATRLAFWGEGDDEVEMTDAVRVFDVQKGVEVASFKGPSVDPARPWPPGTARAGWIVADGPLFAIAPQAGTGVWDLATGERLHFEAGFAPRRYHPERREFLSWEGGDATISRLLS